MPVLTAELACALVERIIAKALALNINDMPMLTTLAGKRLGIQLAEFNYPLCLVVTEQSIWVQTDVSAADCLVSSSISSLIALHQQASLTELIRQGKLDITGDIKVAQGFAQLAEALRIDWQSELAQYIGDIATHRLVQLSKSLVAKAKFVTAQVTADSSEWLVQEQKLLVSHTEMTQFISQVQQTEQLTAQLAQRLERLLLRQHQP